MSSHSLLTNAFAILPLLNFSGGPQGITACEHVIEHLAVACNVHKDKMRRMNLYNEQQSTHFGMAVGQTSGKWNVPAIWDGMATELKLAERRHEIEEFNAKNKWTKRGAAIVPTKFGIAFTAPHMNQGGALVHLYVDGTVLVSHGGTEMGQGLHTKVCQVAAQAFGIPLDHVYVNDTSTDKVANTIASAASMSTDLYGMCTLDACRQIMARLKPYREKLGPDASLADLAHTAHLERVDLSAHGFYAPDSSMCNFNFAREKPDDYPADKAENSWKGRPFNYFTQGVAYAEVEIDVLTGNHRTLRADVVVDVGSSINPAIDIGQIEGAFFQGMGWSTIEEMMYSDDDHKWCGKRSNLFTQGPGTYKIPGKSYIFRRVVTLSRLALNSYIASYPLQRLMTIPRFSMYRFCKMLITHLRFTVARPLENLPFSWVPLSSTPSRMP